MKQNLVVVLLTAAVLVTVIFIAIDLHQTSERTAISQFQEQQRFHAQQAATLLEFYLRIRSSGMGMLSSLASLRQGDQKRMRTDLQTYLGALNEKQVKAISVFDKNGTIIYSTSDSAIGRNYAQSDFSIWAKRPESKGKFFLSPVLRALTQGEGAASFQALLVTPLYQDAGNAANPSLGENRPQHAKVSPGNFIGALSMTIDLGEGLAKQLTVEGSRATLHNVWVMNEDGTLLFQSEHPEMVLRNINQEDRTCNQCHTSFDHAKMILAEKRGTVEYELKNLPKKLAAFAPMEFENARWIVVVNTPYDEITGFIRAGLAKTLLLIGIVAFVFVGGSVYFQRSQRLKIRAEEEAKQWRMKRELEEKIRQSEERYRTIVETAHDIIWMVDRDGNFIFANKRAEEITGYKTEDWIGKSFAPFILPEDRPKAQAIFLNALQGIPQSYDARIIGHDGKVIVLSASTIPLYEAENVIGAVSFGRDVTEQKRAEEALWQSEQKHRIVADNTYDWEFWMDPQKQFLYCSPSCTRVSGHEAAEFLADATLLDRIVHPDDRARYAEHVTEALSTGLPSEISFRIIRPDGTVRWIGHVCQPILSENGDSMGRRGSNRDITERKQAELERERLVAELQEALANVKTLSGLIPICATCKKIRDDKGYWNQLEAYVMQHSDATFTHGICPDCIKRDHPEVYRKLYGEKEL